MPVILTEEIDTLDGVATLAFKLVPVAILTPVDETKPAIGGGAVAHPLLGKRVAVAVCDGNRVFAALLTPAETETYAHRLLRAAAVAQSEGSA